MFALAKRTVDDHQHQVGILGGFGGDIDVRAPSISPSPGVSTEVTLSIPGQGISFRVTVVPPRASVANTSRPASRLSTDDLPLEIVPNATISSV